MTSWRVLVLGILCIIFGLGCEKECTYKSLPNKKCQSNYNSVSGTYNSIGGGGFFGINQVFIINDDSTYKSNFSYANGSLALGEIDFTTKSLIAVNIQTNMASDFKSQGFLCKNENSEKWIFHVDYSLKDQCKGSRISRIYFTASFICDKIDSQALVQAKITDVNPF